MVVNTVILGLDLMPAAEGSKRPDELRLKVLLAGPPDGGGGPRSLPGVWSSPGQPLERSARDLVAELSGEADFHLEGLGVFDPLVRRDGRLAFASAFLALVGPAAAQPPAGAGSFGTGRPAWAEVRLDGDRDRIELSGDAPPSPIILARTVTARGRTTIAAHEVASSPLALDHAGMLLAALRLLKDTCLASDRLFNLMPDTFSLNHLQSLFETVRGQKLQPPAFRRKIAPRLKPTAEFMRDKKFRPARLFSYDPGWRT